MTRAPFWIAACALLSFAWSAEAHAAEIVHVDFAPVKPKEDMAQAGAPVPAERLRGARVEEGPTPILFAASERYGPAITLQAGSRLVLEVEIPKAPEVENLEAAGWYGVASVDVLGLADETQSGVTLHVVRERGRPLHSKPAKPIVIATGPRSASRSDPHAPRPAARLWVHVPADVMTAHVGKTLALEVHVEGPGGIVIDDLRFERFHAAPRPSLLGKPNGKNGPDRIRTGALGFTMLAEHRSPAASLLKVREGGPAAKAGMKASDLIVALEGVPLHRGSLAANQAWFDHGLEASVGRAVERAVTSGSHRVRVTVLRAKGTRDLMVKVPHRMPLEPTLDDAKVWEALRDDVLDWIASRQKDNGFWPGNEAVNSSLAGLALLGSRNRKYRPALRKLAKAFLTKHPHAKDIGGFSFWAIAFQGMFLAEYHLATGNRHARAWVEETIAWLPSTTHPSKWGMPAFGHSPKGLPYDNKALMAPCAHLLVLEALALRCGIESGVWAHIEPYVRKSWSDPETKNGHGGMGYNPSYKDKGEFWSRTGLTALALHLRGEEPRMSSAMARFMTERHVWMLNSHAYGEPGGALGLLALATVDPEGFAKVLPQWRWRFLSAWEPGYGLRYSTAHMGAPYMGEDEIMNVAYGCFLAVRTKGLVMTGGTAETWLK